MIGTALTAGGLTAIGLTFLAMKFGNGFVKKLLAYDWAVDVAVTVGLMWIFAISGTISGMLTGIMAGLLISIALYIAKRVVGYKKLVRGEDGKAYWKDYQGDWSEKVSQIISTKAPV